MVLQVCYVWKLTGYINIHGVTIQYIAMSGPGRLILVPPSMNKHGTV